MWTPDDRFMLNGNTDQSLDLNLVALRDGGRTRVPFHVDAMRPASILGLSAGGRELYFSADG